MHKRLLTICFAILMCTGLFAQEVPEVQKTLLTKVTATWCPNCGSWGWDFFEHLIEDNTETAIFVGAHHSGDLSSAPGSAFSENFNAPYQPYFYAGNVDLGVTNGNVAAKRISTKEIVDANALIPPVANTGFNADLTGEFLSVDAKAKFFQEATGDFYLGVYVLENGVINNQASNSTTAVHPFVIRDALTDSEFGNSLMNGTITAGTEFTQNFAIQVDPNWNKNNLSVIGIIWNKVDDKYQFVNVNSINEFESNATAVQTIDENLLSVSLYPTLVNKTSAQLDLNLKTNNLNISVQVFNQNGQLINSVFKGQLNEGPKSLEIDTDNLNAGIYYVNVRTEDGAVLTKKMIVQ